MRNRFFVIILATLILGTLGINYIHLYFFKSQRLNLIDDQILHSTSILLNSNVFKSAVASGSELENTISKVLGGNRIGKVFIIRDQDGKILYESFNVGLLQTDLPMKPEWITIQAGEQYVRIQNSVLTPTSLVLQVGSVLDRNFINWSIFDQRTLLYIALLVSCVFILSALLTLILLAPIRNLSHYLLGATADLQNLRDVTHLPDHLTKFAAGVWAKADEFSGLVKTIQKLIDRINQNYKLTRSWTLQMAHEIKTPIAVIRAETDAAREKESIPETYANSVTQEVDRVSETINQFLDWAELENLGNRGALHMNRLSQAVKNTLNRLEKISAGRIQLQVDTDLSFLANPIHFDQLLSNLVTNALKFSPETESIEILVKGNLISVQDKGPGIADEVLERLGQPFNIGSSNTNSKLKGSGLGLAWVVSVCRHYGWELSINKTHPGTKISVRISTPKIN